MTQEFEIKNALIRYGDIQFNHDCLTIEIGLKFGEHDCIVYGGYRVACNPKYLDTHTNVCGISIWRILEIANVSQWNSLRGIPVRVKMDSERVRGIGHYINDDWFSFEDLK